MTDRIINTIGIIALTIMVTYAGYFYVSRNMFESIALILTTSWVGKC